MKHSPVLIKTYAVYYPCMDGFLGTNDNNLCVSTKHLPSFVFFRFAVTTSIDEIIAKVTNKCNFGVDFIIVPIIKEEKGAYEFHNVKLDFFSSIYCEL